MLARAARIHGRDKVAVSEIELPQIGPDELLMRVVSSSMCLSTYKALSLGEDHKRVPEDVSAAPAITGHEFAGVLEEVGEGVADRYAVGQHVAILPTMGLPSGYSPGYSYPWFGGDATYCIIPKVAIDKGCVLPYDDDYFANGSLAEPMSCIIGAFHASYHTEPLVWQHQMGIRTGGALALLGAAARWGLAPSTTPCTGRTAAAWSWQWTSTPRGCPGCGPSSPRTRRLRTEPVWSSSTPPRSTSRRS
jgi:threonine dehydrogenase-like Zn-dependent dehydrogenase